MKNALQWLGTPPLSGPASIVLVRWMTGGIFLWEGILKFVYVNQGVGRFTKIGIPFPAYSATFVGAFEIVGGLPRGKSAGMIEAGISEQFPAHETGGQR